MGDAGTATTFSRLCWAPIRVEIVYYCFQRITRIFLGISSALQARMYAQCMGAGVIDI